MVWAQGQWSPAEQLVLALAAYASYAVNALQYLRKLRLARLGRPAASASGGLATEGAHP